MSEALQILIAIVVGFAGGAFVGEMWLKNFRRQPTPPAPPDAPAHGNISPETKVHMLAAHVDHAMRMTRGWR